MASVLQGEDAPELTSDTDRLRLAFLDAWRALDRLDQELLRHIAQGHTAAEMLSDTPEFRNQVAISRRVQHVSEVLLSTLDSQGADPIVGARTILDTLVRFLPFDDQGDEE